VIVTAGPAGDGVAFGEAVAGAEDAPWRADEVAASCFTGVVPEDPVQAAAVNASTAPAATAESARIALM
jgi:hypothetical protein